MANNTRHHSRRDFIRKTVGAGIAVSAFPFSFCSQNIPPGDKDFIVSIVKIKDNNIIYAVEEAIDLLGGINTVTAGKDRIMLKPNLVAEGPTFTTQPEVIKALALLIKNAGKDVSIGEGSAAAGGFNATNEGIFRTKKQDILDGMQQYVFDQLGYTDLAQSINVPLVNLHSGEMTEAEVQDGYLFDKITLHNSVAETDLLCSVPMMKTHVLATVTLSMKNLIGVYPGTVYYSVRSWLHDHAAANGSPGVGYEIVDMLKAVKTGLVVIDASRAMEGDGPTDGSLVDMGLIIAGNNPLAADMVTTKLMSFNLDEVPAITLARQAGMGPDSMDEIEVRGEKIEDVRKSFKRPNLVPWPQISPVWGNQEI
ncbi:MAG: hypothetical protein AMS27_01665 [Bacteroides sp. SM23_62_1]|nr:MAG: hypothetical protein AMS27_01665 [Bacteroides sp. SM23_62_1]